MERRGPKIKELIKENEKQRTKDLEKREKFNNTPEGQFYNKIRSLISEYIDKTYVQCDCCDNIFVYDERENKKELYDKLLTIVLTDITKYSPNKIKDIKINLSKFISI